MLRPSNKPYKSWKSQGLLGSRSISPFFATNRVGVLLPKNGVKDCRVPAARLAQIGWLPDASLRVFHGLTQQNRPDTTYQKSSCAKLFPTIRFIKWFPKGPNLVLFLLVPTVPKEVFGWTVFATIQHFSRLQIGWPSLRLEFEIPVTREPVLRLGCSMIPLRPIITFSAILIYRDSICIVVRDIPRDIGRFPMNFG